MNEVSNNFTTTKVPPSEARPDDPVGRGFREAYVLHLADNSLIMGHRLSEWTGHGPVLEQDIAISNIALDLIGQSRNFYQYAAEIINSSKASPIGGARPDDTVGRGLEGASEDDLAYLRNEREFKNILLTELPNGDWAKTILKLFFFSTYQYYLYQKLTNSSDKQLSAIAEKSLKEVTYHVRWSSEWVIRLGDGTEESHKRIQNALEGLWSYTGEMFVPSDYESATAQKGIGVDISTIKNDWKNKIEEILQEATLPSPFGEKEGVRWMQTGGKNGLHTEHLGFILAEMQYMQRAYPGCKW